MKRAIFFGILFSLCLTPFLAHAQTPYKKNEYVGFGGVIIVGNESRAGLAPTGTMCESLYGPIWIKPIGKSPVGPFFINKPKGDPRIGKYIVGTYKKQPEGKKCTVAGPYVPAFEIVNYGVSTK